MSLRFNTAEITKFDSCGDGKLKVTAIARHAAVLRYANQDGTQRLEFVSPEANKALDSDGYPWVRQLGGAIATNEHPMRLINGDSDLANQIKVGEVLPKVKVYNDGKVEVEVEVFDSKTIDQIRSGEKTGLSLGYTTNVVREDGEWNGQPYTHKQTGPFYVDHVAICSRPRAPEALITKFDSVDDVAVQVVEPAKSGLFDSLLAAEESKQDAEQLYQIEVNGRPFMVPLDLYLAIKAESDDDDENEEYEDSDMKKYSDLFDSEDEGLLKEILMDAKAKKAMPKVEEDEDMEDDEEEMDEDEEEEDEMPAFLKGKKDSDTVWMSDRIDSLESEVDALRAKCDAQDKLLAKFDSIDLDELVSEKVDAILSTYNELRPYLPEDFKLDGNASVEQMKLDAIKEMDSEADVSDETPEAVLDSVLAVLTRYHRKDSTQMQARSLNTPARNDARSVGLEAVNNFYANAWKGGSN